MHLKPNGKLSLFGIIAVFVSDYQNTVIVTKTAHSNNIIAIFIENLKSHFYL